MAYDSARSRSRRPRRDEDLVDAFDVPAAILCAFCGQSDCPGCGAANADESGVIAIIPWERHGSSAWTRLWATATATTQGAEKFFAILPDGEISPAMRFAIVAELLAVISMVAVLVPIVALALPTLAIEVAKNPSVRVSVVRWLALGVPALALWMVAAHVTHGAALDAGARRQGGAGQRRRAVRFGLYSCGWDLMAGPLGAIVTFASKGLRETLSLVEITMVVPGKASMALLAGVYKLPHDAACRARRAGSLAAAMIAILTGAIVLGTIALGLVD